MEERRRSVRLELEAEISVQRIDQPTGEKVHISVTDMSKSGLGFRCDASLEKGAVYECFLTIWTKEVIQVFIEIVRREEREDGIHYGASFIGMNDLDSYRIQIYQTMEEYRQPS